MKKIILNDILSDYKIPIYLENNVTVNQVFINPNYGLETAIQIDQLEDLLAKIDDNLTVVNTTQYKTNKNIISTYDDVINHFKPSSDKYFVTGITESKFSVIDKYFPKKIAYTLTAGKNVVNKRDVNDMINLRIGIKINIPSLDISAMILNENNEGYREYVFYLDTENPIKYIDSGPNLTKFTYLRSHETYETEGNMCYFDGINEEPKITSELFIDRGLISVFNGVKKLKTVRSLNELNKVGLNYFKINKKGYNFKNL